MDDTPETINPKPTPQAASPELRLIKRALHDARAELRDVEAHIIKSKAAVEHQEIEILKSVDEKKRQARKAYGTATRSHTQLLCLRRRLRNQIGALKKEKRRLENESK